jgi:hypothetical protein
LTEFVNHLEIMIEMAAVQYLNAIGCSKTATQRPVARPAATRSTRRKVPIPILGGSTKKPLLRQTAEKGLI